ncbi:MAG: heme peroxidase [Actinomycetota bacterium]|nr:heme peroxidase [Actinomycetota bacterium]
MSTATRRTARDGIGNRAEFLLTTRFEPLWNLVQANGLLRRTANRRLVDRAIEKMATRPDPLSTRAQYTSWASLTDRRYDGRHLGPVLDGLGDLPSEQQTAELFRRPGETVLCPKSTVLFAYFAQWFTDGFLRSDRARDPDPRKNDSTHEIDLCQIYGLTQQAGEELRAGNLGLLESQTINGEEYPPYLYAGGRKRFPSITVAREEQVPAQRRGDLFAIGTDTANVQIGHVLLNVLFLREHNRVARELHREHPGWDDERLFQTARNVLIVVLIKIVVEEYINHITPYLFRFFVDGTRGHQRARWMRTNRMASEFNLLYRWHSLIPTGLTVGGRERTIDETAFNPALVVEHGLGRLFEEAARQPAGRVGLFNTAPYLLGAEVNSIRKGRDVALASYNDYREHCRFPRVTDFDQISSDPRVRDGLRDCYGSVERIEFYVGLFAEDARPNSVLPSLIGRMVGVDAFSQALTNPLLAPRVFHPRTFSPLGWQTIATTRTLSDVLQRNVPEGDRPYLVTMTRTDWRRR